MKNGKTTTAALEEQLGPTVCNQRPESYGRPEVVCAAAKAVGYLG